MTPKPDPIAAIERAPNRIQGMVRSIDQYRNGDPKAILAGSEAQALYALTDARHDVLVLWDFAVTTGNENVSLARQAAEKDAEIARLKGIGSAHDLINDWIVEDTEDLPDDTGVTIKIGNRSIILDELGNLRRACSLSTETSDAQG